MFSLKKEAHFIYCELIQQLVNHTKTIHKTLPKIYSFVSCVTCSFSIIISLHGHTKRKMLQSPSTILCSKYLRKRKKLK